VALLLGAAACASAPRNAPPGDVGVCTGPEVLVVRNETGAPVEIYEVRGSLRTLIGTAHPGPTEFSLIPAGGVRRSFWGWPAGGRRAMSRLRMQVVCR
jgi:hypothetical protein